MTLIKVFIHGYGTYFEGLFEYRPAFFTDILTNIISYSGLFFGLWVLMDKFKLIQGWTMYEVLLIFNLNLVSYAICAHFMYTGMCVDVQDMIRSGRFDIVLTKPMNAMLYMLLGRPTISHFGHILLGMAVFWWCFSNLDLEWSALKILFLVAMLLGAALIQGAIFIITGTFAFWIVRTDTVFGTFVRDIGGFINYPINIYIKAVQVFLTFIVPFAFINYYPAHFLLEKDTSNLFHPILQFGTPVVGIVTFFLAYRFWRIGINKYESTGS